MRRTILPNAPIVFDDETAASVLIRAAEANGHTNVYQLLSGTGIKINEPSLKACLIDRERYRHLVRAVGFNDDTATRAFKRVDDSRNSPRHYGTITIPDRCFRRDDASTFCAQCLKDRPYWRQLWLIRPFAACIAHKCLLVDRCRNCGRVPSIGRGELARCNHCRASLLLMHGNSIDIDSMSAVQQMLDSGDADALNSVLEFWSALERFDGLNNAPADEYTRLQAAISFSRREVAAFEHVVTQVVKGLPLMNPRVQLLSFLSGSKSLIRFAEDVISHVSPLVRVGSGDSRLAYLSKSEVCTLLQMPPAKLAQLIRSGQIKWPSGGRRQQRIPSTEIEMYMQGFSQTEIFYVHSAEPYGPLHRHDK